MNTQTAALTIGRIAQSAGVAIDTIRFYERETASRLRFTRRAKDLGFTLDEIRELLALSADRNDGVEGVRERATARLKAIDERIAELQRVRDGLSELVDACPGHGAPEDCPILK